MKTNISRVFILLLAGFLASCSTESVFSVISTDGQISAKLVFDKKQGTVIYSVYSKEKEIIADSPLGIITDLADFTSGMKLKGNSNQTIDETYTLPQGKVSVYHNNANEQTLKLKKDGKEMNILFRVYNDGIAFRYSIPGDEQIEITDEISTIFLTGENFTYWGQKHPNRYGYESALGPIDGELMSVPVLAYNRQTEDYLLMGQAATNGNYIQPHFQRTGSKFKFCFPLDQEKLGPVISKLPFQSPWRMVIISPKNPGKIVESYLVENLNPPTDIELLNQDGTIKNWIRPGNVMWDYIAKDGDKPRMWINAASEMGWEYYMADAGFANRWGGNDSVPVIVEYAKSKNVGIIGWAHTREFNTREKAAETMKRYAGWGLKGAKIDFFDHNTLSENPKEWRDYEDTQQSLQMRDWIFEYGIKNSFLLELHGNTVPSGERRQYPNLMTLEGVDGMERRTKPAANDLTIPYVRNVVGPVSYTIIHFERCPGTHAYQLAMAIVYEAGLKIYAEHGKNLLKWAGREIIQDIPCAWDETKFIMGIPASHVVVARRKGQDWYIGGMTDETRNVSFPLYFLDKNKNYNALTFSDKSQTEMLRNFSEISNKDTLSFTMLPRGGFAVRLRCE